jgi:cytochrome c2
MSADGKSGGAHARRGPRAERAVRSALLGLVLVLSLELAACGDDAAANVAGGNIQRGKVLIAANGCGSCHQIPGIDGADADVGPPLNRIGRRIYIAGMRRNTPEAMIAWLQNPQAIVPGNAMPNMGLSERDARDIAAYLYTLR